MAMNTASKLNTVSVMGSSYFYFIETRFFAGLFCRSLKLNLSGT